MCLCKNIILFSIHLLVYERKRNFTLLRGGTVEAVFKKNDEKKPEIEGWKAKGIEWAETHIQEDGRRTSKQQHRIFFKHEIREKLSHMLHVFSLQYSVMTNQGGDDQSGWGWHPRRSLKNPTRCFQGQGHRRIKNAIVDHRPRRRVDGEGPDLGDRRYFWTNPISDPCSFVINFFSLILLCVCT